MILGMGIDLVDIERFSKFHLYSPHALSRVFSSEEIAYCLKVPLKSAERFAVRFAAKEALFKALCHLKRSPVTSFLNLCKISSLKNSPIPHFSLSWESLELAPCLILVTITHSAKTASAIVLLQKI